ncbi:MAG: prolipoprotein diacylglyceryl transferase [Clostridia bacterium]|nr:prolipoprotein diacylglyceryl transferase [Clostridia bacterium]
MNDDFFGLKDSLGLNSYALMMILAAICGLIFLLCNYKKFNLTIVNVIWMFVYCIVFGLLGARLFHVLFRLGDVFDPNDNLRVIDWFLSGWMYYGGLLGGMIGLWLFCRKEKCDLALTFDFAAIILPLVHAIGRVGCFLSGCCYGRVTDSSLGVCFKSGASVGTCVYPTNLYEVFFNTLLFIAILLLFVLLVGKNKDKYKGLLTTVYLLAYPVWRFVIEFLRDDDRGTILYLFSTSQFISIFLFALGIYCAYRVRKHIINYDIAHLNGVADSEAVSDDLNSSIASDDKNDSGAVSDKQKSSIASDGKNNSGAVSDGQDGVKGDKE